MLVLLTKKCQISGHVSDRSCAQNVSTGIANAKRGILKHHLTEIQHCYSPDGRPMKVIVLKNGEVYVTCMQFLS